MIDGALYQRGSEARGIMAVPTVFLNGEPFGQGRMSSRRSLPSWIPAPRRTRRRKARTRKYAFDVLVVGGGPAGSAAAIYAARKGIRTGVVAERFGGQVLDTLASRTSSRCSAPKAPSSPPLEQHVKRIRSGHHEPAARQGPGPGR
jgi:alkyl hydroperoxide reductase subunit F